LSNRLLHNFLFHYEITTGELHFAVGKSPFHDPIVDAKALEINANAVILHKPILLIGLKNHLFFQLSQDQSVSQ